MTTQPHCPPTHAGCPWTRTHTLTIAEIHREVGSDRTLQTLQSCWQPPARTGQPNPVLFVCVLVSPSSYRFCVNANRAFIRNVCAPLCAGFVCVVERERERRRVSHRRPSPPLANKMGWFGDAGGRPPAISACLTAVCICSVNACVCVDGSRINFHGPEMQDCLRRLCNMCNM